MSFYQYFDNFVCQKESKKDKKVFVNSVEDYENIIRYNFTIKELKEIIKRFKLPRPKSDKKGILQQHCINCLLLYSKVNKIQKCWRNHFIKLFNDTLGPAFRNRKSSNNIEDFMTIENVNDIDYYDFFSFKDKDNFVYSFNILSIHTLISKHIYQNPYNRIKFDKEFIDKILLRAKFNKILKKQPKEMCVYQPPPLTFNQKIARLFQKMDELGNYTNQNWFLALRRGELCKFLYELFDIWNYRAQLSREVQISICPPNGNPFGNITPAAINHYQRTQSIRFIQQLAHDIMDKMLFSASNNETQNLGALYILSALTLVSENARSALPWLYASVQYIN